MRGKEFVDAFADGKVSRWRFVCKVCNGHNVLAGGLFCPRSLVLCLRCKHSGLRVDNRRSRGVVKLARRDRDGRSLEVARTGEDFNILPEAARAGS